jgi:geranylgeranyl diphosphate synthase, type I
MSQPASLSAMLRPAPMTARPPEPVPALYAMISEPASSLFGLRACDSLAQVERLMEELTEGEGGDLLGEIGVEHLATGGKRLRARLCLAAMEAMGAPRSLGTGWAAACELLHNATLIHDDVQDGDRTRRGHPTVWARHGVAQAINAGDLMLMIPFLAVDRVDVEPGMRWHLGRMLAECAALVARGQATEISVEPSQSLGWAEYRTIVARKTGALFQLPVQGAALLAGRSPAMAQAIALEFQRLGVLFQLQDDVLDLYGDKGREAPGSDLCEGKVTALVIEYLQRVPTDGVWLAGLLAAPRGETDAAQVREAIHRFYLHGALDAVLERMMDEAAAVAASAALAGEPAIRKLALELVREIIKPIAHLFLQDTNFQAVSGRREPAAVDAGDMV